MFTLLNTLFLNPLPVERPSELVAVFTMANRSATQFGNLLPLSYPNLKDFRERNSVLTALAGYSQPLRSVSPPPRSPSAYSPSSSPELL